MADNDDVKTEDTAEARLFDMILERLVQRLLETILSKCRLRKALNDE